MNHMKQITKLVYINDNEKSMQYNNKTNSVSTWRLTTENKDLKLQEFLNTCQHFTKLN